MPPMRFSSLFILANFWFLLILINRSCCYCETEHLTFAILNSDVCTLLVRNIELSFSLATVIFLLLLKLLFFRLNLSLNSLFCYTFTCVYNPRRSIKGFFKVAKVLGYVPRTMLSTG